MDDEPREAVEPRIDTDELSPGEARIARLKAAPRSLFHFGLMGVFWLMLGSAILMALPRGLGIGYDVYFVMWYGLFFVCMPLVVWTVWIVLPRRLVRWRYAAAGAVILATGAPILVAVASDPRSLRYIIGSIVFFWLPQVVCIAAVRQWVFAPSKTRPTSHR